MGYKSNQFTKPVDENLFCSICYEVFQDPVSCKDGHTFCSACIEQWLKTSKTCPLDNGVISGNKLPRNYIVKGIVDNLEVRCDSFEEGGTIGEECSWVGKLQELVKHRGECRFQLVQCKYSMCTVKEQPGKIEDHMKICDYKPIVCRWCRVRLILRYKDLHVQEYCPKTMVSCPNRCLVNDGCSYTMICRMDVEDHMANTCSKTLVECPFKEQGCSVQVERQHVDQHVQDNMSVHMLLLAKENKQLKEELNHVKENLRSSNGVYVWKTNLHARSESPVFLECGHKWKMFLYYAPDRNFETFYLAWHGDLIHLKTQDTEVTAFVRLSILSNTPDKPNCTVTQCHTFTKAEDALQFRHFIEEIDDNTLQHYYSVEGLINIECSIRLSI